MPVSRVYVAAAAMIVIVVAIWWLAWDGGYDAAMRKWGPRLHANADTSTTDPLNPAPVTTQQAQQSQASPPVPAPAPRPTPSPARTDPRVAGSNYLLIASSMPETEARSAAEFLTSRGVPAFCIPVDPTGRDAKNRGLFKVYSALEIKPDEYRAKHALRAQHQQEVARLGAIWRKEHNGSRTFAESQTFWEKYRP